MRAWKEGEMVGASGDYRLAPDECISDLRAIGNTAPDPPLQGDNECNLPQVICFTNFITTDGLLVRDSL